MIKLNWLLITVLVAGIACAAEIVPHFPQLPELAAPQVDNAISVDMYLSRGRAAFQKGDYTASEGLFVCARIAAERSHAARKQRAEIEFWLGQAGVKLTRFAEAERHCKEAVALWTEETGATSPETLRAVCSLAGCYRIGGYFDAAETLYKQLLAQRVDTPEDLDSAEVRNGIGDNYRNQAKSLQAEANLKRALDIRTRLAGPNDALTAQSTVDLGKLYWQMTRYKLGNETLEKGYAMQVAALGPEHPDLIETLDYWADGYTNTSDYKQGEVLLERARVLCEKTLGKEHARYSDLMNDLALVYEFTNRPDKAEKNFKEALRICKHMLGENHYYYAIGLNNVGRFYTTQVRYKEAESYFQQSLDAYHAAFGDNHANDVHPRLGLIGVYEATSRFKEAEDGFRQLVELREKYSGKKSIETADSLLQWALFNARRGDTRGSDDHVQRALAIIRGDTQADAHVRGGLLIQIAQLYSMQGRFREAESFAQECLKSRQASVQKGEALTMIYLTLSTIYSGENDLLEANKALASARQSDPGSIHVAVYGYMLGRRLMDNRDFARAETLLNQSIAVLRNDKASIKHLGSALVNQAFCLQWQDKNEEAEPIFKELVANEKAFGTDTPEFRKSILSALAEALFKNGKKKEAQAVTQKLKAMEHPEMKLEF